VLKSLRLETNGQVTIYLCAHWKSFPPPGAVGVQTPEDLRARKVITETEYQRLQVWRRICGLPAMAAEKCLSCPHLRRVRVKQNQAYLVSPNGQQTPLVDKAVLEAGSFGRDHLVQTIRPPGSVGSTELAPWVKHQQREGSE
jgi:hypothetical protein